MVWQNQHKGLAIFAYNKIRLTVLDNHNEHFKMIIPIAVTGKNTISIFLQYGPTIPMIPTGNM